MARTERDSVAKKSDTTDGTWIFCGSNDCATPNGSTPSAVAVRYHGFPQAGNAAVTLFHFMVPRMPMSESALDYHCAKSACADVIAPVALLAQVCQPT